MGTQVAVGPATILQCRLPTGYSLPYRPLPALLEAPWTSPQRHITGKQLCFHRQQVPSHTQRISTTMTLIPSNLDTKNYTSQVHPSEQLERNTLIINDTRCQAHTCPLTCLPHKTQNVGTDIVDNPMRSMVRDVPITLISPFQPTKAEIVKGKRLSLSSLTVESFTCEEKAIN